MNLKYIRDYFRNYDIRGEVHEEGLNEALSFAIGRAIGSEVAALQLNQIIVAQDGRLSSPSLTSALIDGIISTGCDVIDIGRAPTPLVYFATHRLSANSGVVVTGSHNPKDHNGYKIVINGKTLSGNAIKKIYDRIVESNFVLGQGKITLLDITDDYIEYVSAKIILKKPLRIIIDCGNGIAGTLAPRLLRSLGCDVHELYCDVDGNFPNHHPDPSDAKNLASLIGAVLHRKADIGFAFDGDGDRLGVVTDKGEIIYPDRFMVLFAKDLLSRHPGAAILFDVKCSSLLEREIIALGGVPVMCQTGHSLIKNEMIASGALLAGEMSGHIFLKEDWFGFDDALFAAAKLTQIITNDIGSLSHFFAGLPDSTNTPELKIQLADNEKATFMRKLLAHHDFNDYEKITIDGLRVNFGYGWGLVRPSNTTANLVLRFEANNAEQLTQIQNIFKRALLSLNPDLVIPF